MPFQPQTGAPPAFPPTQPVRPPPAMAGWTPPASLGPPPVTAGSLLKRTVQVWWRNFGKLALLELAILVPILVVYGLVFAIGAAAGLLPEGGAAAGAEPTFAFVGLVMGAGLLVGLPLAMLMLGATNFGVVQWLAGRPAGVGDMLKQGARKVPGLVLAGLLVGLAFMGGYILLVVPGIMVAVATIAALPAVSVEGLGAVAAFKRSLDLTRGFRWAVFAALLAIMALTYALAFVGMLFMVIPILGPLLYLAVMVVVGMVPYVLPAVVYHDLRVLKEGVDTTQLSQVFE
jgi:hypothetical protein